LKHEVAALEPKAKEKVMRVVNPWFEEGMEKGVELGMEKGRVEGRQEGRIEGRQEMVLRLLRRRLGNLPARLSTGIACLSADELDQLAEDMNEFAGMEDLRRWLGQKRG
jgi:predicted transposase YdaD